MFRKKNMYIILILTILSLNVQCGTNKLSKQTNNTVFSVKQEEPSEKASYISDLMELSKIVETINLINERYVGEAKTSKEELYNAALAGILSSLEDPYSEYLTKEELKQVNENLDGTYSGVGMSIRKEKGKYLEVISPFIGSPAFKAGIQIGDIVTKINGKDIKNINSTEATNLLKGKKGTEVKVEILTKSGNKIKDITIVRDEIVLEIIETNMLEDGIGYISLMNFGNKTSEKMKDAISELKEKGMKKLILDLRTNPGGSLNEAIDISSLFVKEEVIVSLKYKEGEEKKFNRTLPFEGDFPMVVLVNKGSASASEIVSGVLKDYKRATLIGEKTYGKGVVQGIIKFKTEDAIKLTIAEYFTPKKNVINKKGIEPDIYIKMKSFLTLKGYANETEEAKKIREQQIKEILIEDVGKDEAEKILKQGDRQLKAAIDFLNGKKIKSDEKEKGNEEN